MDSCRNNYENGGWPLPTSTPSTNCIMSPTGKEIMISGDKMNSLQRKAQVKLNTMPWVTFLFIAWLKKFWFVWFAMKIREKILYHSCTHMNYYSLMLPYIKNSVWYFKKLLSFPVLIEYLIIFMKYSLIKEIKFISAFFFILIK